MLNKLLYNIGLYDIFYEGDYDLMNIKNNLKPTVTLTRKFYTPTENEIINKYQMRENRNKPKIKINELIEAKKNLIHINKI
tara:strand:+ start:1764 stop:2006 length:243 start_codon:yes stop_codon:yes gene_type:complete